MSRQLSGGRPYDVVALEARNQGNERLISHLNIQIDYLQQQNGELQRAANVAEDRALAACSRSQCADGRNEELAKELDGVDLLAQQLQLDKDSVIRAADDELAEAKHELVKSRNVLEDMDTEVIKIKDENVRLACDCDDMKARLQRAEADALRLGELVDRAQEDKRKLSHRVNKLTATERELVLEMDAVRHRRGAKPCAKIAAARRIEALVASAEEERNYWKSEADMLQRLLRLRGGDAPTPPSPGRRGRPATPATMSPRRAASPAAERKMAAHYEAIVRGLEDERDHFRNECDILKTSKATKLRTRSTSPYKNNMVASDASELARVRRERDDLQGLLDKFERHMSEIQANVKVLTTERDTLSDIYEETKDELARTRREVVNSPRSSAKQASLAAKAVLRRVESERNDASADLLRMLSERDSLRERLKICTDTHLAEKARLEQYIEDLLQSSNTVEEERSGAEQQIRELEQRCGSLERRLEQAEERERSALGEGSGQAATAQQMRLLADKAEASVRVLQADVRAADDRLAAERDRTDLLQRHLADARRGVVDRRDEVTSLRAALESLDRDKDAMTADADERAETIARHEADAVAQTRAIADLQKCVRELEETLGGLQQTVGDRDHEVASLRRQLDANGEELVDAGRGRQVALRENRRLNDDLGTMTQENQTVNQELCDALAERELLRTQVHKYICEVKRVEELLAAKENERSDLLEHYRTLSLEAERFETATHQLESQGSSLRLELVSRDGETRRLESRVDELQRELDLLRQCGRQYEDQVSQLSESLSRAQLHQRTGDSERRDLQCDHAAVRDLCAQLEAAKVALQRQLAERGLDIEKLESSLDEARHEAEVERGRAACEQTSVRKLESLLQTSRDRDFQTDMAHQEAGAELQLLRDRLTLNDSRLESQNRDVMATRKRNMDLEAESERLRRQLTNERFERERTVQELHRHGLPPPLEVGSSKTSISPISWGTRPLSAGRPSPLLHKTGQSLNDTN